MPRVRSQLAIQASPELLDRVRAAATAQRRTVTSLVVEWIEAGLSGAPVVPGGPAAGSELKARVQALEAAVAQLQAAAVPRSERRLRPGPDAAAAPPEPAAVPLDPPAGGVPTAELAVHIGMKRGSLNERLRRMGGARVGLELDGWRCVGQAPAPGGGPLRWLWQPA
jgi:hypothetical protein